MSMENQLSTNNTELHNKSWHLFTILLAVGHPVHPIELASRCRASFEASPEFVEFICSIPDLPLSLTSNGFVTVSSRLFLRLKRFFLNSSQISVSVPSRLLKMENCGPKRARGEAERTYYRKRRRLWPNDCGIGNLMNFVTVKAHLNDLSLPVVIQNGSAKVFLGVDDDSGRDLIIHAGNPSTSTFENDKQDEVTSDMPSLAKFDGGLVSYGSNNHTHERVEVDATLNMDELGGMNVPTFKYTFVNYDSYICLLRHSTTTSGAVKACIQHQLSSHLTTNPVVQRENMNDELYLLSKTHCTTCHEEDDKDKEITPVKTGSSICSSRANEDSLENQRFMEERENDPMIDGAIHQDNDENLLNTNYRDMMLECDFANRNTSSHNMISYLGSRIKESVQQAAKQSTGPAADAEKICTDEAHMVNLEEEEERVNCSKEEQFVGSHLGEGDAGNLPVGMEVAHEGNFNCSISIRCKTLSNLDQDKTAALLNLDPEKTATVDQKQMAESSTRLKVVLKDVTDTAVQAIPIATEKGGHHIEQQQYRKDKRSIPVKQELKQNCERKMHTSEKREKSKENKEKPTSVSAKDHSQPRAMPKFDSFIVEEEEGSGGYGTVYKARRKNDGITFAVKYPHVNANRHHVLNELKMLERFGGKNFVIKYEGSFKSGNSHCLVLEHVAHDRPEALKREIDVYQLQWYGYCLFRALVSLHKQGVVHRDVKPGNFLFSCKASKGYLIDFNLAIDLHQKYGSTKKSKVHHDTSFSHVPTPRTESLPPMKSRNYPSSKALEAVKHELGNRSKLLLTKNLRKKLDQVKEHKELNKNGVMKSQGADGSGITSAKDATSTRAPSAERLREPIPCQGRKELLNLVHEAMQGPDHVVSTPSSKRKRVAAPPAKLDKKFIYLTPMPLHCTGIAVPGARLLNNRGEGKQRREGPCVGTKGFRAPEVLFKSTYQGPKVDIWSAGVTLLYLILGRTPFAGDPDQNIKEIAKLRGSEDLWEVAKLHDRESSFPPELFEMQYLAPTKLREWCKQNTRRPEFLEVIPKSLLDLVDKCLTVNPRTRISAEDALRHEFFAPCMEGLKKQRLLRQGLSLDSGTTLANAHPLTC